MKIGKFASYIRRYLLLLILFGFTGCTVFNGTKVEGLLGADENLIKLAYKITDDLEKNAYPRLIRRHPDKPVVTTTFVNNNDLNKTSQFSRILQEHMNSRFVQLGYSVKEIKLREKMLIRPKDGEKMLSRDISEIQPSFPAQAISAGTYNFSNRIMYISARLINPENSNILSSVDYKVVMDKNMLAMFGLQIQENESIDLIDPPRQSFLTWLLY